MSAPLLSKGLIGPFPSIAPQADRHCHGKDRHPAEARARYSGPLQGAPRPCHNTVRGLARAAGRTIDFARAQPRVLVDQQDLPVVVMILVAGSRKGSADRRQEQGGAVPG